MRMSDSSSIVSLVPMAHVKDVLRSVRFYEQLGFQVRDTFKKNSEVVSWASMHSGDAEIMFALASDTVIRGMQGVLFYLYTDDVRKFKGELERKNIAVSAISFPFYMPRGEIRVEDPDGYTLLIGQR